MTGAIWINLNTMRVYEMKKRRYLAKKEFAQHSMTLSKIEEARNFIFTLKPLWLFHFHGKYHDFIHGKEFIPFVISAKQHRW